VIPAKRLGLNLVQIAAGWGFCAALSDRGNIWTWYEFDEHSNFPPPPLTKSRCRGKGTALGLGPSGDEAEPKQILMEEIFVDVSCGATHAAAIAEGGKLYTWGSGTSPSRFKYRSAFDLTTSS